MYTKAHARTPVVMMVMKNQNLPLPLIQCSQLNALSCGQTRAIPTRNIGREQQVWGGAQCPPTPRSRLSLERLDEPSVNKKPMPRSAPKHNTCLVNSWKQLATRKWVVLRCAWLGCACAPSR